MKYLQKFRGGKIENHRVATFTTECIKKGNVSWILNASLQSAIESADGFSHVGLANLLDERVVLKIMLNDLRSRKERQVQQYFNQNPYRHIVSGLCSFECKDNPVRWNNKLNSPKPVCLKKGNENFIIIVQEYLEKGNIGEIPIWTYEIWCSITLQLTFATLELFSKHNFIYEDWHLGNILIDETSETTFTYTTFNKTWKIPTHYILVKLTDFSRSSFVNPKTVEPYQLSDQIALIWEMCSRKAPTKELKVFLQELSLKPINHKVIDKVYKRLKKMIS